MTVPDDLEEPKGCGIVFGLLCAVTVIALFVFGFLSSPHEPLRPLPVPTTTAVTATTVPGTAWAYTLDGNVISGSAESLRALGFTKIYNKDPRVTTHTHGSK